MGISAGQYQHTVMTSHISLFFCVAFSLMSCASPQKSEWDDLDYSSVYRKAKEREYDDSYTPSYNSCVDDDIINCE